MLDEESLMLKTVKSTHLSNCHNIKDAANGILLLIEKFSPLFEKSKVGIWKVFIISAPLPSLILYNFSELVLYVEYYMVRVIVNFDRYCWMTNFLVMVILQLN